MPRALGEVFFDSGNRIVAHRANDATGLSATLFQWTNEQGGTEYTLSIRSTEYKTFVDGGDRARDHFGGANGEIIQSGFALGQLAALENFYEREVLSLVGAAQINVTGYSLGGHLATVFTETHVSRVKAAYVFNCAGRGEIAGGTTAESMSAMIAQFGAVLTSEPNADILNTLPAQTRALFQPYYEAALQAHFADPSWNPFVPTDADAYVDARYRWANIVTRVLGSFATRPVIPPRAGLGTAGDAGITSIYGSALNSDNTLVANSQVHPSIKRAVFIEGQPFIEGIPTADRSDFGNTHAITLIVDSLALQREFARFDSTLTQEQIESIVRASSAQKTQLSATLSNVEAAEGDSLEKALLALRRAFDRDAQEVAVDRRPGGFGNITNRQQYYEELAKLPQTGVSAIVVLAGKSATEIEALAAQESSAGLAVRYALRELNPFAVVGVDYLSRFTNGELDLYRASEDRGLSPKWLKARATFLDALMRYNTVNGDLTAEQIGGYFEDKRLGVKVGQRAGGRPVYVFGNDSTLTPLAGFDRDDFIFGATGGDTIVANAGADTIEGGGGDDTVDAGDGADEIHGGEGTDTLRGGGDADVIVGGKDGDTALRGGDGGDLIWGDEDQTDARYAGANYGGHDNLYGEEGNDFLYGGGGNDRLEGGKGVDQLFGDGMDVDDPHRSGFDILVGGEDGDFAYGGESVDTIYGDEEDINGTVVGGADLLQGNKGNDLLYGGGGADTILGGEDNDVIVGGHLGHARWEPQTRLDAFASKPNLASLYAHFEALYFAWTGVDAFAGEPSANLLDMWHAAVLQEKAYGVSFQNRRDRQRTGYFA
jgi:hypothetical protein